ncbi:MAG: EF-hand domain-containing protein [Vicinamibacterales bacterium]
MTINGIAQTFSFSAVQLTVTSSFGLAAPAGPVDRVTLSSGGSAPPEAPAAPANAPDADRTDDDAVPSVPVAPVPRDPSRADALFAALDANQDGSVTADEFKDGARRLLRGGHRRAEASHRHDHHHGHGAGRLGRRLERAFDRVDADGDGAIGKDELTQALAAVDARRKGEVVPPADDQHAPADPQDAPAGPATATVSLTVVSIAVQRYAWVQAGADTPAAGPTGPAADGQGPAPGYSTVA